MAIAFDNATTGTVTLPTTTVTYTHTAAGDNRCAVVGASYFDSPAPNPTCSYDSVSMTQEVRVNDAGVSQAALFSLVAPGTGTNVDVTVADCGVQGGVSSGCCTFTGVAQADPTRATAAASDLTVAVTSAADDWCMDNYSHALDGTPDASQTERFSALQGGRYADSSTEIATGASTTMSWTDGVANGTVAVSLIPAAAAPPIPAGTLMGQAFM